MGNRYKNVDVATAAIVVSLSYFHMTTLLFYLRSPSPNNFQSVTSDISGHGLREFYERLPTDCVPIVSVRVRLCVIIGCVDVTFAYLCLTRVFATEPDSDSPAFGKQPLRKGRTM